VLSISYNLPIIVLKMKNRMIIGVCFHTKVKLGRDLLYVSCNRLLKQNLTYCVLIFFQAALKETAFFCL
jgi:hypothetical protein